MKKFLLPLVMSLFCLPLVADVVMNLEIPRSNYMLYEPITANLALRNTSGQVLVFGSEAELQGFMEIELTDLHDRPLPGSGAKINLQGMILRPGTDHHIKINLSKWINLRKVGYYRLKLFIAHPKLKNQFESNRCAFDVSYGKIFWQRNFGVPELLKNDTKNKPLATRSYTLRALQDKNNVFLFLFIEDEESKPRDNFVWSEEIDESNISDSTVYYNKMTYQKVGYTFTVDGVDWKGMMLVTVSKEGFYVITLETEKGSWDANYSTMEQMLNDFRMRGWETRE